MTYRSGMLSSHATVKRKTRVQRLGHPSAAHLGAAAADALNDAIHSPVESRGGENADTAAGREAHKQFADKVKQKPGWQSEPSLTDPATGKTVKPDALTPSGHPVELKPNSPSGVKAGKSQMKKYERATGKRGRVVYRKKPQS